MARLRTIADRASSLLGIAVVATTPVAGGDTSTATRVRLSDGRHALVKTRPHAPAGFFAAEARGLQWLRCPDGASVPDVLAVADDCLIVSWIEPARASSEAAEVFARALVRTHASGADTFGAPQDGFLSIVPLLNEPCPTWPEFYARRRLLPYLKLARDRNAISPESGAAIERVVTRIDALCGDAVPPARIHGDLWSGNLVWSTDGSAYLIDPAAHGGHPETDLAMLTLFGAPHLSRMLDAYAEAAVLQDGWRDRLPLHQLHPLLVHAVMFDGSYGERAGSAARRMLEDTPSP
ncbi:MAG: fructosamine kinase family protein [Propionibacteriales bacterium]|nr:fructosamine kinase family protein [Propionibacteriales bacterium]